MNTIDKFCDAQRIYYEDALKEIKSGRKRTHWMWFIFPQLKALGKSYKEVYFSLENAEDARLFYNNRYLGTNL